MHASISTASLVLTRPGNIQVFMYPGRVCNFQAGTHVPASPRLAQKSKIFCCKNKIETKFVKTLAYLKARCTKTIKYHTLKSNFSEIKFFWILCIIILFIIIWCKNHGKHRGTYQNLQHISFYIGTRVTH